MVTSPRSGPANWRDRLRCLPSQMESVIPSRMLERRTLLPQRHERLRKPLRTWCTHVHTHIHTHSCACPHLTLLPCAPLFLSPADKSVQPESARRQTENCSSQSKHTSTWPVPDLLNLPPTELTQPPCLDTCHTTSFLVPTLKTAKVLRGTCQTLL